MIKKNLVLLCFIGLMACEQRFSKYPIPVVDAGSGYDIERSGEFIDQKLERDPVNLELLIRKLEILRKNSWPVESENYLNRAFSLDSTNYRILEFWSQFSYDKRLYQDAFDYGRLAESNGSNSARFYQLKSNIYNALGEYDEAIDYINKAILINSSNYESYYTKGKIYLSFGDTISALKFMEIGLSHYRNNHQVLYEVADIYAYTKRYDEAERLIAEAISFAPYNEDLKIKQAEIFFEQDKTVDAKRVLKASYSNRPNNYKSAYRLGQFYMDSLQYDSVIVIMNDLVLRDSLNLDALLYRAQAYDKKGFYTSSIGNYQKILSVDSTYKDAYAEWENVMAKRAYLQKLKEEQQSIPSFDFFTPKKKNTN